MRRATWTGGAGIVIAGVMLLAAGWALGDENQAETERYRAARLRMVERDIARDGHFGRTPVRDTRVLDAIRTVERHKFVPPELAAQAYDDNPLPIGYGQTISQPYIVAIMTE